MFARKSNSILRSAIVNLMQRKSSPTGTARGGNHVIDCDIGTRCHVELGSDEVLH